MAKVGRAARNASLMRVESVSSDKTIGAAETGEVYFVDASAASVTLTLPPVKAGAYIKVILSATNGASTTCTIQTSPNTVDVLGKIIAIAADMADGTSDAGASGDDKIVFPANCALGSWVELVCDGSAWYACGMYSGAAANGVAFAAS